MTFWELIEKGGVVMYPIFLFSIVGVVVFFERLWSLQRRFVVPPGFVRALRNVVQRGDLATAETMAAENGSAFANVAAAGVRHHADGRARMKEAMEERGQVEVAQLGKLVDVCGTVAAVEPLMGLLGTVFGMIKLFKDVAQTVDPAIPDLARGIWEALITTAAGLSVAIPVYVGYRYLLSRVDSLAAELEAESIQLLDVLAPPAGQRAPEPERPTAAPAPEGAR